MGFGGGGGGGFFVLGLDFISTCASGGRLNGFVFVNGFRCLFCPDKMDRYNPDSC